jgi:hypothetical protein
MRRGNGEGISKGKGQPTRRNKRDGGGKRKRRDGLRVCSVPFTPPSSSKSRNLCSPLSSSSSSSNGQTLRQPCPHHRNRSNEEHNTFPSYLGHATSCPCHQHRPCQSLSSSTRNRSLEDAAHSTHLLPAPINPCQDYGCPTSVRQIIAICFRHQHPLHPPKLTAAGVREAAAALAAAFPCHCLPHIPAAGVGEAAAALATAFPCLRLLRISTAEGLLVVAAFPYLRSLHAAAELGGC